MRVLEILSSEDEQGEIRFVIVGESEYIQYQDYNFEVVNAPFNSGNLHKTICNLRNDNVYLSEVREHDDLDNTFILLSNKDILRINIVDNHGKIQEELTYHKFECEPYFNNIRKWFDQSEVKDIHSNR